MIKIKQQKRKKNKQINEYKNKSKQTDKNKQAKQTNKYKNKNRLIGNTK